MAYGLMKDIRGYHIELCLSSNSTIEKSYDGYTVFPVIVAGGLPNLVILSSYLGTLQGRSPLSKSYSKDLFGRF